MEIEYIQCYYSEQCNCCACPEFSLRVGLEPSFQTEHSNDTQTEVVADKAFSFDWAGNQALSRSFVLQSSCTKGDLIHKPAFPIHQTKFGLGFGSIPAKILVEGEVNWRVLWRHRESLLDFYTSNKG